ncbi:MULTISPECIES: acyl-CoA dehydrogenase family protein [unclassified Dietzia]|uniref:acyl-CoA dehydrogenase family protein n=1 Tax=unclassified Dietzia TaxID=2617939 RepID=UPI000D21B304|nr:MULTISPECIES: acyl-CoA dehydrogenase family protein [unclassified Dietzia]AVZ40712.1 DNA alkylation response protein [Dietzia sp. JS16-p6b]QGW26296.1 isovaleryl CoA dehydrogenase [Dietzia sp. DQ12-45-1b]
MSTTRNHTTHEVLNQAPPRVDVDEFALNPALREAVGVFAPDAVTDRFHEIGRHVGTGQYQHDAELANTLPPVHHAHDRWGNRVDEIEFHPSYHRIMDYSVSRGLHTSAWADPGPGANVERAAGFMLVSQIEAGHGCPLSMTHAVMPSLRLNPGLAAEWEPALLSTVYDPELRDPATKSGVLFGMAMTEKQGGSDVRANTTTATPVGDGLHVLRGHKWFCSAPQSDAFLVLAQAPEGLSCFLVPRVLPGGERNPFLVQRLKDKLGNKSNASSEVEFDGTLGWMVGEPGRGVRTIIEMVGRTRLDCVLGSTAGMRQGVAEAAWHARHRAAFGATLVDQPAMAAVLADLQLEAEAATWTATRLAAAYDDDESAAYRRLATAVAKYWTCKRGPNHAYESLECLGGNGYTEAFPLARRYREQPVLAVWEGSGNVIALDVLRAMAREPESVAAFEAELAAQTGRHEVFDRHVERVRGLIGRAASDPAAAPAIARRLVEAMALGQQGAVLLAHAPAAVAEAFCLARLGDDRSAEYGALPDGVDVAALVARA